MDQNANTGEYVLEDEFETQEKGDFKAKLERFLESRYFLAAIFILLSVSAFFLGRISVISENRPPVRIFTENGGEVKGASIDNSSPSVSQAGELQAGPTQLLQQENGEENSKDLQATSEKLVGSKSGTKYHYPWCPGAKQIAEKNLITFSSIEEARAKGYTPASNCKGLK